MLSSFTCAFTSVSFSRCSAFTTLSKVSVTLGALLDPYCVLTSVSTVLLTVSVVAKFDTATPFRSVAAPAETVTDHSIPTRSATVLIETTVTSVTGPSGTSVARNDSDAEPLVADTIET